MQTNNAKILMYSFVSFVVYYDDVKTIKSAIRNIYCATLATIYGGIGSGIEQIGVPVAVGLEI